SLIMAGVDRYAVEPTGQAGGIQLGEIAIELEEDVLGNILRVCQAAGETQRGDQDQPFVLAHHRIEGRQVSGAGSFEGGSFRRYVGRYRHGRDGQSRVSFHKIELPSREKRVCKID